MSYSDLYIKPHCRPSKILIAFAVIAVVSSAIFFFTSSTTPTRASKKILKQHEIVNLTPQQAGIFWESEEADEGFVIWGERPDDIKTIALDVQDIEDKQQKRIFHYVLLKNLSPDTTYYYKIVSNNELITASQSEPFTLTTGPQSGSSGVLTPAYGKVFYPSGEAAKKVFVLLRIPEAHPLLAVTGNTGEWLIPLQYFVSKSKNTYIIATNETASEIKVFDAQQQSVLNATLGNTHPVPQTTVLGENYNFLTASTSAVLSAQTKRSQAASNTSYMVSIRYPRNGSVIPGNAPLIKGYGIPGKIVTATIDSRPGFSANVAVDKNGDWTVPMTRTFLPGKYRLSIKTENADGRVVQLESRYTLIKSGEQVLGDHDSTPSATLAPEPTSSIPTPTDINDEPIEVPTPTIIENGDEDATPTPPPPVSGLNTIVPYMMTGVGLVIMGAGILLLL